MADVNKINLDGTVYNIADATARSRAEGAASTASAAQTAATQAKTAAETAQSTASAANTAAGRAQSAAETAQSTATAAQSTATTAKNTADSANSKATANASGIAKIAADAVTVTYDSSQTALKITTGIALD